MKAEELMIGDWVKFVDGVKVCVVVVIKCDARYLADEAIITVMDKRGKWFDKEMDFLKPIPLTSEILKLNGFEREGGVSRCRCGDYYITVFHWNENRIEFLFSDQDINKPYKLIMDIQFVHQLQHALRLFGINKQIKL